MERLEIIDAHVHPKWSNSYPLKEFEDPTVFARKLLKFMDEQGIGKSIVLPISPFISNEYVAKAVSINPERLIGFASVQPGLGRYAIEELEHAVKDLGLKGLKLHPHMQGFSLRGPKVWNCIKKAGELKVPVIIHCMLGDYSSLFFKSKPAFWLATVEDYALLPYICPNTVLIYAHMGGLFKFEEVVQCASFENVYLETSYSILQISKRYPLADYITLVGGQKFIFGSDFVLGLTPPEHEPKVQIEIIKRLNISEDDKINILGGNIRRILKI